mmetsp:Transcript_111189/g.313779  ORF Transcript_111189/g.313779 Transcript_111189/m.313779 type:complete len:298 (+) Transcript_111189:51-944(+)
MSRVLAGLEAWEIQPSEVLLADELGIGRTADVFAAAWGERDVAVKVIKTGVSKMTQQMRDSMCRELAILTAIDHDNAIKMLGIFPDEPISIVMELCWGGTIFELLHESDVPLSWMQNLKMLLDTANVMMYLHDFNPPIIHRDLKSLNILLASEVVGPVSVPQVKVADFGFSRTSGCHQSIMTKGVGTVQWMAPESIDCIDGYDERVDVYSFAILMYEIICRAIPFEEVSDGMRLGLMVLSGRRPDVGLVPEDTPADLEDCMRKCWHEDPAQRLAFKEIHPILESAYKVVSAYKVFSL